MSKKNTIAPQKFDATFIGKQSFLFLFSAIIVFAFLDYKIIEELRTAPLLPFFRSNFYFYLFEELTRPKNILIGTGFIFFITAYLSYIKKTTAVYSWRTAWMRYSGRMFLSVFIAHTIASAIQIIAGRYSPLNAPSDEEGIFVFHFMEGGYYKLSSMPSMHVAVLTALIFGYYFVKKNRSYDSYIPLLIIPIMMTERIITLNNYFSDTIIGVGIGVISAYIASWFWQNFIRAGERAWGREQSYG